MTHWQGLAQLLHDAVHQGTIVVERVHQDIARAPLEMIAKVPPLERVAREVAAAQAAVIGATYTAIRGVNEAVGALTAPPESRRSPPREQQPEATSRDRS